MAKSLFDQALFVLSATDLESNISEANLDVKGDFVWLVRTDHGCPEDYHVEVAYATLRTAIEVVADMIRDGETTLQKIVNEDEVYLTRIEIK